MRHSAYIAPLSNVVLDKLCRRPLQQRAGGLANCSRACSPAFSASPAVMVRRSAITEVGGYDESLLFEDFDMWLRLSRRFSFVYLPGRLVRQRMHSHSMSSNPGNAQAMLGSRAVLLSKRLDAGLDAATRNIVLDALAWTAALQLRRGDPEGARKTLRALHVAETRPARRRLNRMAMLPGASHAAPAAAALSPVPKSHRAFRSLMPIPAH
jgi:hypothetical protein